MKHYEVRIVLPAPYKHCTVIILAQMLVMMNSGLAVTCLDKGSEKSLERAGFQQMSPGNYNISSSPSITITSHEEPEDVCAQLLAANPNPSAPGTSGA